ncbi:MAG: hypothetical protein ACOCUU_03720 [Nanoarchaeota archaeon]
MKKPLLKLIFATTLLLNSCESDENKTKMNKPTENISDDSEPVSYEEVSSNNQQEIIPDANNSDEFAIVYPQPGEIVEYRDEMRGIGINKKVEDCNVKVKTDKWYTQSGNLNVSDNGSWKYSSIYFGGHGKYNEHTIEMKVRYTDGSEDNARIEGIVKE